MADYSSPARPWSQKLKFSRHHAHESDACLAATPAVWWKPYYANSAFSARGLKDLSRVWLASGKPIRISQAPTRWGRASIDMIYRPAARTVSATVDLARAGSPRKIQVKLRMPKQTPVRTVTVNGRPATLGGPHNDTVIIATGAEKHFEIIGSLN